MDYSLNRGYTDEELSSQIKMYRSLLIDLEQERARRREEKRGLPHWMCESCMRSFRSASDQCPDCGETARAFLQSHLPEVANG